MKELKVLVLALLSMLLVGVAAAGPASATLPTLLDASHTLVKLEKFSQAATASVASLSTLGQTKEWTCAKNASSGELEEKEPEVGVFSYLGPFHITFSECKITGAGGEACTGTGEAGGVILVLGEWHLVEDILTSEGALGAAILFLLPTTNDVEFTCHVVGIPITLKLLGALLCLIKPVNMLAKHFEIVCEKSAVGDPKEVHYWNDKGVQQTAELKTAINGAAEEMTAWAGTTLILSELEVEIMV
jgi:hypothetical protein